MSRTILTRRAQETAEVAQFSIRVDPAFEPSLADPHQFVLLLKDLRASIRNAATRLDAGRRGEFRITNG